MNLFPSISRIDENPDLVVKQRYGYIETVDNRLFTIQFRPWPKLISSTEVLWIGGWKHDRRSKQGCRLFFNQPISNSNYLILSYIESSFGSSFGNLRLAMEVLDSIAMIKRSDAILCELTYARISDRAMERIGWERHLKHSRRRHWIKRFYGDYSRVRRNGSVGTKQSEQVASI